MKRKEFLIMIITSIICAFLAGIYTGIMISNSINKLPEKLILYCNIIFVLIVIVIIVLFHFSKMGEKYQKFIDKLD